MLAAQQSLLRVFGTLEQAEESRLVFIDTSSRRVLLSDIFTAPFAADERQWDALFKNIGLWLRYRLAEDYWNERRIDAESAAVREARKEHKYLSREELRLIRVRAGLSVDYDQSVDVHSVDGYEFCICEGLLRAGAKAEAVGVWRDGEEVVKMVDR